MLHFRDNVRQRAGKAVRRYFDRLYKLPHKACRKNNGQIKVTKTTKPCKEDGELSSSTSSEASSTEASSSSSESSEEETDEETESEEHQSTCSGTTSCQSCKARRKGELEDNESGSDEIKPDDAI